MLKKYGAKLLLLAVLLLLALVYFFVPAVHRNANEAVTVLTTAARVKPHLFAIIAHSETIAKAVPVQQ